MCGIVYISCSWTAHFLQHAGNFTFPKRFLRQYGTQFQSHFLRLVHIAFHAHFLCPVATHGISCTFPVHRKFGMSDTHNFISISLPIIPNHSCNCINDNMSRIYLVSIIVENRVLALQTFLQNLH